MTDHQPQSPSDRRPCPTCRSPVTQASPHFPFCSARCRRADLAKWFNGDFVISRPVEESDLDEGE